MCRKSAMTIGRAKQMNRHGLQQLPSNAASYQLQRWLKRAASRSNHGYRCKTCFKALGDVANFMINCRRGVKLQAMSNGLAALQ